MEQIMVQIQKKAAPGAGTPKAARESWDRPTIAPHKAIIPPALGFLQAFSERSGVFYEIAQWVWVSCETVREAPPPVYGQGWGVWL